MERRDARLSNGRFAPKSRPIGRQKGTPNKTTRAIKEFLAQLVDDGAVQDAVRERILAGDAVAFFRAIDHVLGKPKETIEANVTLGTLSERIKRARERLSGDASKR
jgi:hypothetical protein